MSSLTPDDLEVIASAVDEVLGRRLEQVYADLEGLQEQLGEAVSGFNATAQVLHDNDTVVMAEMARVRGDGAGEYATNVVESWRRFIVHEAEELGMRVLPAMVPKS